MQVPRIIMTLFMRTSQHRMQIITSRNHILQQLISTKKEQNIIHHLQLNNKKAQLTQRERTTAVHVWRPLANKCKIRKILYFSAEGHSRSLLSVSIETRVWILLVINCNLGPISHRFRDMATFRLKSLPPRAVQPFKVIQGHPSWSE